MYRKNENWRTIAIKLGSLDDLDIYLKEQMEDNEEIIDVKIISTSAFDGDIIYDIVAFVTWTN